jgi:serine/threonine-protein kinase HipA
VTPPGSASYSNFRRDSAIAFGATIGINTRAAQRELDYLIERVQAHAGNLYQEYEDGAAHGVDPGEARLLRGIIYGPVKDMLAQLQ